MEAHSARIEVIVAGASPDDISSAARESMVAAVAAQAGVATSDVSVRVVAGSLLLIFDIAAASLSASQSIATSLAAAMPTPEAAQGILTSGGSGAAAAISIVSAPTTSAIVTKVLVPLPSAPPPSLPPPTILLPSAPSPAAPGDAISEADAQETAGGAYGTTIGIAIGVTVGLLLLVVVGVYCANLWRRRKVTERAGSTASHAIDGVVLKQEVDNFLQDDVEKI